MKLVKDFIDGDILDTQLLVGSASKCVNNVGSFYLNLELRDATGTINGKKWEVVGDDEAIFVSGNVIDAKVEIVKYKDALQCKVLSASLVKEEDIDIVRFLKEPPVSKEELTKKFLSYVDTVKDPDYKAVLSYFIDKYKDRLYDYPAASSIHHEYHCGLLMHCTSMADIASTLEKIYPDIDHDLLFTGILLHDFGKMTELEGPVIYKYSLEGKLLGHISIMNSEIKEAFKELKLDHEKEILLEHLILSHHGQLEFGSPVLPLTKEALLLSLIDNLDSRMNIVTKALEDVKKGEFSQKVFALENRMFYKH